MEIQLFTKEEVINIVARFGLTYNTDAFLSGGETLSKAVEEVKNLIDFDEFPGTKYENHSEVFCDGKKQDIILIPSSQ